MTPVLFQKKIYSYYEKNKRDLPWRKTFDPYKILVSEMMLQQTQSARVIPKYHAFLKKFPNVSSLARAHMKDVLLLWQGLGYNRRALYLSKTAKALVTDHKKIFPKNVEGLCVLPGIGPYTASAIMVFAYNKPEVVIETNIRAVFIHFFFPKSKKVPDAKLLPLIEKYMDTGDPRKWYNALMDYGAMLKSTGTNPSRKSAHHVSQSKFEGSLRQVRGAIVRAYSENPTSTKNKIIGIVPYAKSIVLAQYEKLENEGFFN